MSIKILTPENNSDTIRLFELEGYPSVIPNDGEVTTISKLQNALSNSPAARHILQQFGANDYTKSIAKEVGLQSRISDGGDKVDVISVTLTDGHKWDQNLEQEIIGILEERLSNGCGIALSSRLRRDFADATIDEVRGVLKAIAPIEVSIHNKEKAATALKIPDNGLDKANNLVTVFMGEACTGSGSSCSSLALMSTQRRIGAAMMTYYGVQTRFEIH